MNTKKMLQGAIIAAIYIAVTLLLAPISYGPLQIRISEGLTVLPALSSAGIPGLIIGCIISNFFGPYGLVDVVFGTIATGIAAFASYKLKGHDWLVPLPPVITNGIVVGGVLHFAYGVPGLWACMGWVALGEFVACYVIGLPLLKILKKHTGLFAD